MMSRKRIFWLWVFLIIGFALRINNLAARSLWIDEFFTFFNSTGHGTDIKILLDDISRKDTPDLLTAKDVRRFLKNDPAKNIGDVTSSLIDNDTHPPLYFWLMHFWMRIFRDAVLPVRLFSVLAGLSSIFLAYKVTQYLFNKEAAVFSMLFMAMCAFSVRFSQEARSYSLLMTLGLLSWLFLLRLEKYNKSLDMAGFAFFNCLGIYTHYFYALLALAQFVYFTIAHRRDSRLLDKFYLGFLCSLLFLLPWWRLLMLRGYKFYLAEWVFGYPGLADKIYNFIFGSGRYIAMFAATGKISDYALLYVGLLLLIYLAACALKNNLKKYPRQFLFCITMFLVPLLSMFLLDIIEKGAILKQERFWLFPFLGIIPLAGLGLYQSFIRRRILTYALILFMLISSLLAVRLQFGPAPKDISVWINKESVGQHPAVIVYNMRSVVLPQSYYLNDDAYLIPVSSQEQLKAAITDVSRHGANMIFIVRYFHRTDPSLTDSSFMDTQDIGPGFRLKDAISGQDIRVTEYIKCAS